MWLRSCLAVHRGCRPGPAPGAGWLGGPVPWLVVAACDMPPSVREALLSVLCHGRPVYDVGYVGWGTPGLFSMLNSIADELLVHAYRGERPRDVQHFYRRTQLLGYGNVSLERYFWPWECELAPPPSSFDPQMWAVPMLLGASRYDVVSHLLHLLYRPRAPPAATENAEQSSKVRLGIFPKRNLNFHSDKPNISLGKTFPQ